MAKKFVKDLPWGSRVEVVWEDAHYSEEKADEGRRNAILCYDLGYFERQDRDGIRIWREIDEDGEFRWDMNIPTGTIKTVRRLGPPPRGITRPKESA